MRLVVSCACALALLWPAAAFAQEPPPKIGPFVVDLHGTVPRFPEDVTLAGSRAMTLAELPGSGLGIQIGLHLYLAKWRAITFGVGGEFTSGRATQTPAEGATGRAATETFRCLSPQISFNFGNGNGWSYISGGIGWATLTTGRVDKPLPDAGSGTKTINYGGGARWFSKTT